MFLSDQTMRLLMELDAPPEQKVALLASMRADEEAARPVQTANAQRQAKHRAKKALQTVTEHNTVTPNNEKRNEALRAPLSLAPSPLTPQPHTHSPGNVSSTRGGRAREDAAFERFWAAYPRKTAKADARKAFAKAWRKLPPMDEEPILIGGLERAKASWTEAQFIPHAATWLNGERWQDEPEPATPRKAHGSDQHQRPTAREDRLGRMLAGAVAAVDERTPELGRCDPGPGERPCDIPRIGHGR